MFKLEAGVDIVHVPYKGGGPAMQDVIAGHVKIMFSSLIQTTPLIKAGRLRPLGTGGTKRSPVLPDVPTIAEAGVPGYAANNWWGIFAPAGTPKPIVDKLYKNIQLALQSPEMLKEFELEGAAPVTMTLGGIRRFRKGRNRQMGQSGQGRQHQGAVATFPATPPSCSCARSRRTPRPESPGNLA